MMVSILGFICLLFGRVNIPQLSEQYVHTSIQYCGSYNGLLKYNHDKLPMVICIQTYIKTFTLYIIDNYNDNELCILAYE